MTNDHQAIEAIRDILNRNRLICEQSLLTSDKEHLLQLIRSLCVKGILSRWTHASGLTYWTKPGPRPLSEQSLVRSLGVAVFDGQFQQRRIVTSEVIGKMYPSLHRNGLPSGYYIDRRTSKTKLGLVRVDSSNSKLNRIANRAVRTTQSYRKQPEFRRLIDDGLFEMTWIVPTHAKRKRLEQKLCPLTATGIGFQVIVVPLLLRVLAPIAPS